MIDQQTIKPSHELSRRFANNDIIPLLLLALVSIVLHIATNGRYGFHRDELAFLNDGRHLAWGYVAYPPLTPLMARVGYELFGTSLIGFRLSATLALSLAIVLTGLMAREMGGNRFTQIMAAMAAAIAPTALFHGSVLMYSSFDYLWWVLTAYGVVRLLKSENPRWWMLIGISLGAGLMTKFTIAALAAGVFLGVLFTSERRYLRSGWFWLGVATCFLIILPNLIWQIQHDFLTFQFLRSIHARDVALGRANGFLYKQAWSNTAVMSVPLWIAGLYYLFFVSEGKRHRVLGWMYVVPLAALLLARGREYYLAPVYPMLIATGAVFVQQWAAPSLSRREWLRGTAWWSLSINGIIVILLVLRFPSPGSSWWKFSDQLNGGNFSEEFGWQEMTRTVAEIRDSLPAEDRQRFGVLAGDAGEAGAIDLYGPAYGLPQAISGSNSFWLHGYGDPPPQTVVAVGFARDFFLGQNFESCTVVGKLSNAYGVTNSAIGVYTDVFLCRNLRKPWPELWKTFHWFG